MRLRPVLLALSKAGCYYTSCIIARQGQTDRIVTEQIRADSDNDRSIRKIRRRRVLLIWICADLSIAAILLLLLFHRPAGYQPQAKAGPTRLGPDSGHYLDDLLSELFRQARRGRPFELVVLEQDVNMAVSGRMWMDYATQVSLHSLTVGFSEHGIKIIGTAQFKGANLVVSGLIVPSIDSEGMLRLEVKKVKVGALNLTPVAVAIARHMFHQQLEAVGPEIDLDDIRTKIAAALLDGQAFEPVFDSGNARFRMVAIRLVPGQAVLRFEPARKTGAAGGPAAPPSLQLRGA